MPKKTEAQPRQRRGWASEHSHLQKMSSYLVSWLPKLDAIRTLLLLAIQVPN